MKIEIKLENPKLCNKCPLLGNNFVHRNYLCELDYFYDKEYDESIKGIMRPQKCIQENGE